MDRYRFPQHRRQLEDLERSRRQVVETTKDEFTKCAGQLVPGRLDELAVAPQPSLRRQRAQQLDDPKRTPSRLLHDRREDRPGTCTENDAYQPVYVIRRQG